MIKGTKNVGGGRDQDKLADKIRENIRKGAKVKAKNIPEEEIHSGM
jgi:hypothetical protein